MNRILAMCLCVALILGPMPRVAADDTDIFGANIQPNILVFIDSSGSMDDYIDQAEEAPAEPQRRRGRGEETRTSAPQRFNLGSTQ